MQVILFALLRGDIVRKIILHIFVLLMVLASGCITLSVDSKVNKNGEIVQYDMTIDTNSYVYSLLNSQASEDGKTLRESVVAKGGQYEEVWDGDNVKISIKGLPPENAYAEKDGDYLTYRDPMKNFSSRYQNAPEDTFGRNGAADSLFKIHYYLEMPGEIVDSNADFVDGNKAEWHMVNAASIRDIYAKSKVPLLPGFGPSGALLALLVAAFFVRR